MSLSRIILVVIVLLSITLAAISQINVSAHDVTSEQISIPDFTTKALLDSSGAVNVLWTVHSNATGTAPGIWYAKYQPNGTLSLNPTRIWNSDAIQSADMSLDRYGNPHIVWAEGAAFKNSTVDVLSTDSDARLYYLTVNSSLFEVNPIPLTGLGRIAMWPSIAVDNQSTTHVVWMQVSINTENRTLSEYYGTIENNHLVHATVLAQYDNQLFLDVPRPQMIYDEAYSSLHIAWSYSQIANSQVNSQVSYARVNLDDNASTAVHRIVVADLEQPVQDVSVARGGNGSAYVTWQALAPDSSRLVYVSRISKGGSVAFLRGFTEPSTSSPYLVGSSDSQENLYLVWYKPPPLPRSVVPVRSVTSVSYVRIDDAGSVTDAGNEQVSGTVLAIGVSMTGNVYAVSSVGVIQVKPPIPTPLVQLMLGIAAFSAAGIAVTEEGKYRLIRSLTSISHNFYHPDLRTLNDDVILQLLTEKPGSNLREIKRTTRINARVSLSRLTQLERAGYVSSLRVGLSRRFFASNPTDQMVAPKKIACLILNEIKRTPGTWEGKLAQDLGLSQQIVHYHVRRMRTEGLLDVELQGRRKLYRLANSARSRNQESSFD